MKQTAVEWLIEFINSDQYQKAFGKTYISVALVEDAKAMEKEQIIKAYQQGVTDEYGDTLDFTNDEDGEQYYKETYENKK